jgi:hypothetical protein
MRPLPLTCLLSLKALLASGTATYLEHHKVKAKPDSLVQSCPFVCYRIRVYRPAWDPHIGIIVLFWNYHGALRYPIVERGVFWRDVGQAMETTCVSCTLSFRRENHPAEGFVIPVRVPQTGLVLRALRLHVVTAECRNMSSRIGSQDTTRILSMLNGIRCRTESPF